MQVLPTSRPGLRWIASVFICIGAFALAGCGVTGAPITVSISALETEDLSGPCVFELSIAKSTAAQRGVMVFYERGDTDDLYNDPIVRETLAGLNYSVLWAHQCDARTTGDIQSDAAKGPARVLIAALDQLSVKSGHSELATNGIILYGFSAAGVLTATMANNHPQRILGTIQYASGSDYVDLDDVSITQPAAQIPTLILANANDAQSGTQRSLDYFERGRLLGAFWAFAVQRNVTHCCNTTTRSIILPWIQEIANLNGQSASPSFRKASASAGSGASINFICSPDGVEDAQGLVDCDFTSANLGPPSSSKEQSGWLPSPTAANAWLAWVIKSTD